MCTISINNQYNGIELSFAGIPSMAIRNKMKEAGFRWHGVRKIWYAKSTAERMELAKNLSETQSDSGEPAAPEAKPAHNVTEIVSRFGIKAGDILADSFGYNMTIVVFYKVTKIISSTKIELVKIGKTVTDTDRGGAEYLMPDPDKHLEEPIVKQVAQSGYEKQSGHWHVKISSSINLTPWSGRAMYQNTWD